MLYRLPDVPKRQPAAINVPWIIMALIVFMLVLHGVREYVLTDSQDLRLLVSTAFIPARLSYGLQPATMMDILASGVGAGADNVDAQLARYFLGNGSWKPWTLITYAFMHGDWMHVSINSLWLLAFGSPVAQRFGPVRFILFFIVTAIAGVALHYILHRYDLTPIIGASAAVSGAMGAALRFMFQAPRQETVFYLADAQPNFVHRRKALSLWGIFTDRRALTFILLWAGVNFIFGIGAEPLGITQGSVAWEAHMGGFFAGLFVFPILDPVRN